MNRQMRKVWENEENCPGFSPWRFWDSFWLLGPSHQIHVSGPLPPVLPSTDTPGGSVHRAPEAGGQGVQTRGTASEPCEPGGKGCRPALASALRLPGCGKDRPAPLPSPSALGQAVFSEMLQNGKGTKCPVPVDTRGISGLTFQSEGGPAENEWNGQRCERRCEDRQLASPWGDGDGMTAVREAAEKTERPQRGAERRPAQVC